MSRYVRMAALGSSFAAGPGIEPVLDRGARRSGNNYPHLLARSLGAELTDLTVSGATTATILSRSQRLHNGHRVPPQITGLPADADLVTVTAGGNDLGYLGSLVQAAAQGRAERRPLLRTVAHLLHRSPHPVTDEQVQAATEGLVQVVEAVRARAPRARVVLVDYLTIVGEDTRPSREVPVTARELATVRTTGFLLDGAFRTAAEVTGADLVRASEASRGHALGSAEPWVNPYLGISPRSFHPDAAGMAAVADLVHRHLTGTPAG